MYLFNVLNSEDVQEPFMNHKFCLMIGIGIYILLYGCASIEPQATISPNSFDNPNRPRIAIVSFANRGKSGGDRLSEAAMDYLHYTLSNTKAFNLYERDQLGEILNEQNLQMTGIIDASTAVEIGKIVGVSYVLICSITEAGAHEGGFSLLGMVGYSSSRAKCVVQARLVSVETGRVEFVNSGNGKKLRFSAHIMGIGGGSSYGANSLDIAMKKAVKDLAQQLSHQINAQTMTSQ